MKRTAFLTRSTIARTSVPTKCKHCRKPSDGLALHEECVAPWWAANQEKVRARAAKAAEKADRAETRARKAAIQTLPELKRLAQQAFNAFVRERDRLAGHPCISSGKALDWSGNAADCGHYRSVGSAPHLRYDERNAHAQSKQDNRWGAGRAVDYRIGLIARLGCAAVEALEADNTPRKYTREELIAIRALYKSKLAALKAKNETQEAA